ncbi:hypothetical protein BAUCODRAFT_175871 [Baudoinia panamericana UAMH 10762]|uniref:Uncharacterized protein n=1 Tax=Baudoinia panamericana (strain UAMH 10762) TaxID=717646 RepID=M2MUL2_BAUPA|nr:uncharacterized protein BAUCODRAFT_175871 [Baudoinia panamericana UAMH 10762]EMD00617.1 hypothetical protein BAUCODRAFT_175871 [Baudoinia panamericana UAMH 10762]
MLWMDGFFGSTKLAQARSNARKAYRKYYADIRGTVTKQRLLEFELSDGWEPLCKFLEEDVQNVRSPKPNEAKTIQIAFGRLAGKAIRHSLVNIAVLVAVSATVVGAAWSMLL